MSLFTKFKNMVKTAVGKDSYVDFSKDVEVELDPSKEELKKVIDNVEQQSKFVTWIQSFTKKTVVIVFALYILCTIISIIMMFLSYYLLGESISTDTFITENNETFRIVIGGYLIKSGVENGLKISGNYYLGVSKARLDLLRKKYDMMCEYGNSEDYNYENDLNDNFNNFNQDTAEMECEKSDT